MKKDNTITVFYDEVTQRDIYRLNGVDVTDTIEMLKDKWERQILDTRCRLFQLDMTTQQRLQEQIADLEAKLAEKDNTITNIIEDNRASQEWYKKQLAEKTLTIEQINKAFIENRSLWKGKYERANQDKISFAVEQLEKVKEFFLEEHRDEEMDTDYIITKDAGQIADYLLDRIKLLKEGK